MRRALFWSCALLVVLAVFGCEVSTRDAATRSSASRPAPVIASPAPDTLTQQERAYAYNSYLFFEALRKGDQEILDVTAKFSTNPRVLKRLRAAILRAQKRAFQAGEDVADYAGSPPPAFREFDRKALECALLHQEAHAEMLEYWEDRDETHLVRGALQLNEAIALNLTCHKLLYAAIPPKELAVYHELSRLAAKAGVEP